LKNLAPGRYEITASASGLCCSGPPRSALSVNSSSIAANLVLQLVPPGARRHKLLRALQSAASFDSNSVSNLPAEWSFRFGPGGPGTRSFERAYAQTGQAQRGFGNQMTISGGRPPPKRCSPWTASASMTKLNGPARERIRGQSGIRCRRAVSLFLPATTPAQYGRFIPVESLALRRVPELRISTATPLNTYAKARWMLGISSHTSKPPFPPEINLAGPAGGPIWKAPNFHLR